MKVTGETGQNSGMVKELFPNFIGRIFKLKRQSRRVK
jgi:hypothetical protein